MSEATTHELTRRLQRLEREHRCWKLLGSAALALLALVLLTGAMPLGTPDDVRARRFTLADKDGTVRAALGMVDGSPRLELYEKGGMRRVWVGVDRSGMPAVLLGDDSGRTRASLHVQLEGSPALTLADKEGKLRAVLVLEADGAPGLRLNDRDENAIWQAPPRSGRATGRD
jgi:hypothetical protein